MKIIAHYLLLLLFVPAICNAQNGDRRHDGEWHDEASTLSVYSETGEPFMLVLNGISQNTAPTNKIRVEGLPQYGNDIEIIFTDNRTPAIRKRVNVADPVDGKAVNMTLKIVRGREGNAWLKFQRCTEVERDYRGPSDEYIMTYGRGGRQLTTTRTYTETPPPPPPPPPAPVVMDANSFNDAKNTIANASFDDTKLSTAKSIISGNYLTTDQVIDICNLFAFDDRKLAFAKMAYSRTVDKGNYFKVGNVFSFDSDRRALSDFISKQQ